MFPPVSRLFRALHSRNFRIWAAGAAVSNVGTWMQRTAQDWLVLTELSNHDATSVGFVMALQFAPQILFLPWTGYAADRLDRRRLLMTTQGLMGALAIGLGLLTVAGVVRLWEVDVFAFLFGTVAAFDAPVRQTFVADLVGEEDLANAVALNSTSFNAGRMLGPAVAGLCIAATGSGWAFLLNGASFFAVLVSLRFLRVHELHASRQAARGASGLLDGFRYVWARDDLRAATLMLLVIGTFGLNFQIYIATMAVSVFHVGATHYGALNSAMAVGTICGALMAARRARATFASLAVGAAAFGIGCGCAALAPTYVVFAIVLAATGVATQTLTTTSNSFMQLASAPAMRGRVMAIRLAVALGGTPVGAPIAGFVADHWGPRWSLALAALSGIIAAGIALRHLTRPRPSRSFD
jgi:MFS family permease